MYRIVENLEEAINHVNCYSTHHSEAIVTDEPMRARVFMNLVDCSTVYHNASTRFTDGFEFGLVLKSVLVIKSSMLVGQWDYKH